MYDNSARHGPPPIPSTPAPTTSTGTSQAPHTPALTGGAPDLTTILVVAVVTAIGIRIFWKAVLTVVLVAGLAIVFAGIFSTMSAFTASR